MMVAPSTKPPEAALMDDAPLAIICGGGAFPPAVARAAEAAGRRVVMFPLRGFAGDEVRSWPHVWVHLGQFGRLTTELRRRGCRDVVFIGTVLRPRIRDLRLDLAGLRRLPRVFGMLRGGDNHLLSSVGQLFEEEGYRLLGAHEVAPDILAPAGRLGGIEPGVEDRADIDVGRRALEALSPFDVGQAVVVVNGHVVAVEAAEGTDLMLARCTELRAVGRLKTPPGRGVLVKLPKHGQDRRFDLPSLGARTVEGVAKAGLAGIAVEAGGVIVPDTEELVRAADAAGIFLVGLPPASNPS
jgi:DUF1009 family protein